MKKEYDDDQELMDQRDSTMDIYNDEMARKAVGRLFDPEELGDSDDGSYVTGFEKASPKKHMRVVPTEPVDDLDDDDYIPAPPRRNRKETMPSPKPAVKVNIPSPRSPQPSEDLQHGQPNGIMNNRVKPVGPNLEDELYDDDFEEFRQRYRNRESLPGSRHPESDGKRGGHGGKNRPTYEKDEPFRGRDSVDLRDKKSRDAYSDPDPRDKKPREVYDRLDPRDVKGRDTVDRPGPAKNRIAYEPEDEYEQGSPVRWVAAVLSFVFLVILVFLIYRITVLSGQLKEANTQLANMPSSESEITVMRLTIEQQDQLLLEKDDEIERLNGELALYRPADYETANASDQPNAGNAPIVSSETPTQNNNDPAQPRTYTVVKGDSLSKISKNFYNSDTPANIQKIRDANGISGDTIQIGQVLTIP